MNVNYENTNLKREKKKKRGQSTDLLSGTILAKQCLSSSKTPGSPCSRSLQTSPSLSSCLPSFSSSSSPSSFHIPGSQILFLRSFFRTNLATSWTSALTEETPHCLLLLLPGSLETNVDFMMMFIMTCVPEVGRQCRLRWDLLFKCLTSTRGICKISLLVVIISIELC